MGLQRLQKIAREEWRHAARTAREWWRHDPLRLQRAARRAAREFRQEQPEARTPRVNTRIAVGDRMYKKDSPVAYFTVGYSALFCIDRALAAVGRENVRRILDLPCGHGRVLRMLRAGFPAAEIVACDLERDGVDFCARTLKALPLYSAEDPGQIEVQGQFDLIWVGSLFTHLAAPRWAEFLRFFRGVLAPNGVLAFTVHGPHVADRVERGDHTLGLPATARGRLLAAYEKSGFAYEDYQPGARYGVSLSAPEWVSNWIAGVSDLQVVEHDEHAWAGFQDVVVCVGR
jgi:SAM-dependent methyltransferase